MEPDITPDITLESILLGSLTTFGGAHGTSLAADAAQSLAAHLAQGLRSRDCFIPGVDGKHEILNLYVDCRDDSLLDSEDWDEQDPEVPQDSDVLLKSDADIKRLSQLMQSYFYRYADSDIYSRYTEALDYAKELLRDERSKQE